MKFYKCDHCGNIIVFPHASGVPVMCCGQKMEELTAGSVDAAVEKHVPVVEVSENQVRVHIGEVEHPMQDEHYIQFIAIETKLGKQYKELTPEDKPEAVFALAKGDELVAAYEYCNLHGLWKK